MSQNHTKDEYRVFVNFGRNSFIVQQNGHSDSRRFKPQTSTNACRHVCKYVDQKGSAAMLTFIQSAGVTSEVNLSITQGESMQKGSTLALKPRADITRSPKQGYQWPHEKDLCPPKIKKKKRKKRWTQSGQRENWVDIIAFENCP